MVHSVTAHYISDRFLLLFKRLNALSLLTVLITLSSSISVFYSLNQLRLASEHRLQSYTLSEELRLSSDQLTMMARAYAATSNVLFKQYFNQILAIRDGKKVRPPNYHRIYWDFLMPGLELEKINHLEELEEGSIKGSLVDTIRGQKVAFDKLLSDLELTLQEQRFLSAAKLESDALTQLENEAFDLVLNGQNSKATEILYSSEYFIAKANIMRNINEFYLLLEQRSHLKVSSWLSSVYVATFVFILSIIILLSLLIYKSFIRTRLDGSILDMLNEEVDQKTSELSNNNIMLKDAITELKSAQKHLLESEKMSLLGGLVSGVAHEINTPVGVCITASSSQKEDLKEVQGLFENEKMTKQLFQEHIQRSNSMIDITMTNLYRIVDLISLFKKLAVDQELDEVVPIDVKKFVDDIIDTLKPGFKHKMLKVVNEVDGQLKINSYPGAIAQIIGNIIKNSDRHGFESKPVGEIRIRADKFGQRLHLTLSDNGQGMPEEAVEKIFDPFYSYHRETQGTGLGMNIVHTIVLQKLLGEIHCASIEGQGTRIDIDFPVK